MCVSKIPPLLSDRFSGITRAMLQPITTTLRDVQSKLKELLPRDAVLVGHSLDNDLRALKVRDNCYCGNNLCGRGGRVWNVDVVYICCCSLLLFIFVVVVCYCLSLLMLLSSQLIHPHVIDTSLLYKRDFGQRFKLKVLAEAILQ